MKHIHTKVNCPLAIRKTLLGSALGTAKTIKALDSVKSFAAEKIALKDELNTSLKGLKATLDKLKKGIPPLPKEFLKKQALLQKKALVGKQVSKGKAVSPKAAAEVQQLDQDIAAIKERLAHLRL